MAQVAQSVRFSTRESPGRVNGGRGWTAGAARAWLRTHDFRAPNPDRTANQFRFRQFDPDLCTGGFKTLSEDLPAGVTIVTCNTPD